MKIVKVLVFKFQSKIFLNIEKIKINDKNKIIEKEIKKDFNDSSETQYFLANVLNNIEFKNYKVFVNYISNDVLIENINKNFNDNVNKANVLSDLNNLYPNYNLDYDVNISEVKNKGGNKKHLISLVPKNLYTTINEFIYRVNNKNLWFGIDILLFQELIKKYSNYFIKKYIILIQKNDSFIRIYQILNGYIINYVVLYENEELFNLIMCQFGNTVDEIIIDGEYRFYSKLCDKYKNINFTIIDYIERLKNIDEKKIIFAKKYK